MRRSRAALLAAAGAALIVSACAERGDFGRPKQTALSALVTPVLGPTESAYPFTDDEQELRARAWRFLMPAKERTFFDGLLYDFARVGYVSPEYFPETKTWYKEALLRDKFRSPASRFARIADDVSADRALLVPFAASAAQVVEGDRRRLGAMQQTPDLTVDDIANANIRIRENALLIAWVCNREAMRLVSYRHALEHIFIAAPQAEAVTAERQLMLLEHDFGVLRATGCVRPDPFRDIPIDRGLRIPPDGHFYSEEILWGPQWRSRGEVTVIRKG